MDVIALRKGGVISLGGSKASAGVSGDVLLNGFAQEQNSFRRCSGYVEQFDVQSPELTVQETIKVRILVWFVDRLSFINFSDARLVLF